MGGSTSLLGATVLYVLSRELGWNLPSFPAGSWYFNPLTWQILFVFGMWCELGGAEKIAPFLLSRGAVALAVGYLVFAFLIVMTWHVPSWARFVPPWLAHAMYPIDKTNLDPLRLIHFLAMAALAVRYIPRAWPALAARWSRPLVLCGQHSLPIFVLGTFLSFDAHIILVEISNTVVVQVLVSVVGITLLVAGCVGYDLVPEKGRGAVSTVGERRSSGGGIALIWSGYVAEDSRPTSTSTQSGVGCGVSVCDVAA